MEPKQLRKLVRRWALPVLFLTVVGTMVSYAVTKRITPTYEAKASVLVVAGPNQTSNNSAVALTPSQVTTTAASLMTEPPLLQRVINDLRLSISTENLAKKVSATPETNTELVDVVVQDPDPAQAAKIANALSGDFVDQVTQANKQRIDQEGGALQAQINAVNTTLSQEQNDLVAANRRGADTSGIAAGISANSALLTQLSANYSSFLQTQSRDSETVSIAAPASVPNQPASPKLALNVALGATAALLLALAIAALMEYLDQGLDNEEDVRERLGVPCLAVVPRFKASANRGGDERRFRRAQEAYRRLRTNLLFSELDTPLRSIVVTSVRAGEGKTRTAANLAVSLAGTEKSVLLIDADMRRPSQHRLFDKPISNGMSEMLLAASPEGSPVLNGRNNTPYANLWLLTCGVLPPNPSELLASKRAAYLLAGLERQRDLLIIDTPPAQAVTDALSVAAHASGAIVVVEAGKTNAEQTRSVIDALGKVGCRVLGVVLNKAKDSNLGDYYYYEEEVSGTPPPAVVPSKDMPAPAPHEAPARVAAAARKGSARAD